MGAKAASMSACRQEFMNYLQMKTFVVSAIGVSLSLRPHCNPSSAAAICYKFLP